MCTFFKGGDNYRLIRYHLYNIESRVLHKFYENGKQNDSHKIKALLFFFTFHLLHLSRRSLFIFFPKRAGSIFINLAYKYMTKLNKRNSKERCDICSNLALKIPDCLNFKYTVLPTFSSASFVDFDKVNICWEADLMPGCRR